MPGLFAAAVLAMVTVLTAPVASALPDAQPVGTIATPPDGPAQAWLVADLDSGKVLAAKDGNGPQAPASTIKPLLAMVVLDHLNQNSYARANQSHTKVECSCVGLGGQRVAVAAMNAKARTLGARSTRASSPSGLDGPGWETVTTPRDLALIYRQALKYPLIAQIFATPSAPFPGKTLQAQNELLARYPGDFAGKTGYTDLARKTMVTAAQRNGRRLLVVLMYGTGDLYGQAINLLDWGFGQPA